MKLWLNGHIIYEEEAVIPVSDHGFLYGMGLFETFRTYGGEPFLLESHMVRLSEGCRILRIGYEPDATAVRYAIKELLAANGLHDAYIRMTVSAGSAPLGLPGSGGYLSPNVIMYMKELPPPAEPAVRSKALVKLATVRSSPEHEVRMKSFQYMNNIFGKWELLERPDAGNAEGLFMNEDGFVTEGLVSNVFFVREDGVLATPGLETGCLPGVTRSYVMELAGTLGLKVEQGLYRWDDMLGASEVFVTNSIQEVAPIVSLVDELGNVNEVSGGKPGGTTMRLIRKYSEEAGSGRRLMT